MFCSNCGKQIPDTVKFCPDCGAPVKAPAVKPEPAPNTLGGYETVPAQQPAPASAPMQNPAPQAAPQNAYSYGQTAQNAYGQNGPMPLVRAIGFGEAIANFFKKYAEFSGRATRSEF